MANKRTTYFRPTPKMMAAEEMYEALKLARKCIAYCRKTHKDAQSGTGGVPVEVFIDAALAKADGAQ